MGGAVFFSKTCAFSLTLPNWPTLMPRPFLLLLLAGLGLGCAQLAPCFEPTALTSEPCTDDVVCVHAGVPATVVQRSVHWKGIRLYVGGSKLMLRTSGVLGIAGGGCHDQFFCSKSNNPCLNNGTCHSRGHRVVCICPPAYIGERCEQNNRFIDAEEDKMNNNK